VTYDPGDGYPTSVVVADVNGDGKPDIAVVNINEMDGCASNGPALLGNGDGTFQPASGYCSGYRPEAVAVADVNGDGKPDLILANYLCNGPSCFQGSVNVLFEQ
jgi:hypothetical protein